MIPITKEHRIIAIDTMVFIYLLEDNPIFAEICGKILEEIEFGNVKGITSVITLLEIMVKPKKEDKLAVATDYQIMISNFPNLDIINVDKEISNIASTLRANYNIKTPDAIQIATCINQGGTAFFTNDLMLKKVEEVEIVILKDILEES